MKSSVLTLGNTFIYIVALSLVDTMVIMSIPFHMTSMVMDNWLFGDFVCKVYWILEMSNKVVPLKIFYLRNFNPYEKKEIYSAKKVDVMKVETKSH